MRYFQPQTLKWLDVINCISDRVNEEQYLVIRVQSKEDKVYIQESANLKLLEKYIVKSCSLFLILVMLSKHRRIL